VPFPLLDLFPELHRHLARLLAPKDRARFRATCKALYEADRCFGVPAAIQACLAQGEWRFPSLKHLDDDVNLAWAGLGDTAPSLWVLFDYQHRRFEANVDRVLAYPSFWGLPRAGFRFSFVARVIRGRRTLYFSLALDLDFNEARELECVQMRLSEGGCDVHVPSVSAPDLATCLKAGLSQSPQLARYLAEAHVAAHPTAPGTFRVIRPLPPALPAKCGEGATE
jgi:hypothetical protein